MTEEIEKIEDIRFIITLDDLSLDDGFMVVEHLQLLGFKDGAPEVSMEQKGLDEESLTTEIKLTITDNEEDE